MSETMRRKGKMDLMQKLDVCSNQNEMGFYCNLCSVVNDLSPDRISMMQQGWLSHESPI